MTNPDMLHLSLLADHARWADFFFRLSLVVVDEAHVCRGVFGSHVAMVLRRLRRLVAHYGGDPRWVLATATVGNPGELASRLTGLEFDAVVEADAPSGGKLFALWNPPITDEGTGARRSALSEASWMLSRLAQEQIPAIGFTRSRRAAELLAEFTRRSLPAADRDRVKAYRAGYLPEERRKLERQLQNGELLAVAATNALELGIDIGGLDAAVLTGYPGTRASMWQQAGRAGRRETGSLAVLIAQDDPLDQYLVQHPEDLFDRPAEAAVIDPSNPYVLEPHLLCAARERPLSPDELAFFGPSGRAAAERLVAAGDLAERRGLLHHRGAHDPHREVDVRAGAGHIFKIVIEGTGELLGTVDEGRAYAQIHPGAVYLQQGEQYVVQELDLVDRVATVSPADPDFYTQARDVTDIEVVEALEQDTAGDVAATFGTVRVTDRVVSYVKKLVSTNEVIEEIPLPLPPVNLETRAVWWTIPQTVIDRARVSARDLPGAVRGRARGHRPAAPGGHLRPLGCGRGVHPDASRHRQLHDLRLRRLPGRRGHQRAGLPQRRALAHRHPRGHHPMPLLEGLPELRAVPEVRQRQRAARQDRGREPAGRHPGQSVGLRPPGSAPAPEPRSQTSGG